MSVTAEKSLERARDFLRTIPGAAEKATANALNRAAAVAREKAIDAITDRYVVRAGDVREKITLTRATPDALSVSVVARSESLSLGYFPHTPTREGTGGPGRPVLRAEVIRGQERALPGAFVARINGKPKIMIRTDRKTARGRDAIKSVSTVPLAVMLGVESVRTKVEATAVLVLEEHLEREIDRALKRVS